MQNDPLDTDRRFFAALKAGELPAIDALLTDDFILVGVMDGAEVTKAAFLEGIGAGHIKFDSIEPAENRVRYYGMTAIITGRTEMKGRVGDTPFTLGSRYTHVFVRQSDQWRLASAQGTQIPPVTAK